MLSSVDMAVTSERPSAAVTKEKTLSVGITFSGLKSGTIAVAMHEGKERIIMELTAAEFSELVRQLIQLGDKTFGQSWTKKEAAA